MRVIVPEAPAIRLRTSNFAGTVRVSSGDTPGVAIRTTGVPGPKGEQGIPGQTGLDQETSVDFLGWYQLQKEL